MLLLARFKISGHSMLPTLKPGQSVLASSLPFMLNSPKINDLIIFKSNKKLIIKRIKSMENEKYKVVGDNKADSKDFGLIDKSKILGKVIYFW